MVVNGVGDMMVLISLACMSSRETVKNPFVVVVVVDYTLVDVQTRATSRQTRKDTKHLFTRSFADMLSMDEAKKQYTRHATRT